MLVTLMDRSLAPLRRKSMPLVKCIVCVVDFRVVGAGVTAGSVMLESRNSGSFRYKSMPFVECGTIPGCGSCRSSID